MGKRGSRLDLDHYLEALLRQPGALPGATVKERLRLLLAAREPSKIRWRLADFYEAAIDVQLPEATRLANTVQTWWPAILVALIEDVDNARTEGFNRIIKQVKRAGCGYRNMINYQRRILTHIAVTRPPRSAA